MPKDNQEKFFELEPSQLAEKPVAKKELVALSHILDPEFIGLDVSEYEDIPDEQVEAAAPGNMQPYLYWPYVRVAQRQRPERSSQSYATPKEGVVSVALTPEEYDAVSESVVKLGERIFNDVLTDRSNALRKETGDPMVRAQSDEDIRIASRGAVRAVASREASMRQLLDKGVVPKINLINKFLEMTNGTNYNLARGTKATVGKRFEDLRQGVFNDMLDVMQLQRGWDEKLTDRAKQIVAKRLYIAGEVHDRVINFQQMLELALEYYGHKQALLLTKINDVHKYKRSHPDVVADILAIDAQREREKTGQLPIEPDQ